MKLPNTPPKGTQDRFPEEFTIRKYIFDTWRQVCLRFGYQEYLAPLVEDAEIYRAKSGEDVGGSELTLINDRGGRELALRPEMTPSVTRMVTRKYTQLPKPVRYFSIANFYRNEKPQRGRNREFWQLNVDLFGSTSLYADVEMLQLALEIMYAFNPPENSFELNVNNRLLINDFLEKIVGLDDTTKLDAIRLMDKRDKLSREAFLAVAKEKNISDSQSASIVQFMECASVDDLRAKFPALTESKGFQDIDEVLAQIEQLGYGEIVSFKASLMRGFDYYDGLVFEVFDKHPDNNRAMYGGGRYNGLAGIFGVSDLPAVGIAPGDEAMKLFLESRGMIEKIQQKLAPTSYYVPLLQEQYFADCAKIAQELRSTGCDVEQGVEKQKFNKAFQYADKKGAAYVVIFDEQEKNEGVYVLKDMKTGEQKKCPRPKK